MSAAEGLRLMFVGGLVIAAAWDLRTRRIPDVVTVPLALAGLAAALVERGWAGAGWSLLGMLAPALLLALPLGAGWLGGGDVKLLMAAGAWLGPWGALGVTALGSVLGGLVAAAWVLWRVGRDGWLAMAAGHSFGFARLVRERYGRQPIAYGPALALAGVVWVYWGDRIVSALL